MKEDFPPLFGPGRHLLSIQEVRDELAAPGAAEKRTTMYFALFALYQRLLTLGVTCQIWVDGSYVTQKACPDDIDLSIMVHEDVYQDISDEAKQLLDDITYSETRYLEHLDAFVCIYGSRGSDDYELDDPSDWSSLWGKDHSERYLKGFVVVEVTP